MTDNDPMALEEAQSPAATDESLELDDHVETELPAKDNDGIPYCRQHHCRMKQASGGKRGGNKIYYACPVKGCKETAQIIKSKRPGVVPPKPLACPRCSAGKKTVICERDARLSTASSVVLSCPSCGWKSNAMAVPQLAAAHFARKPAPPIETIGER